MARRSAPWQSPVRTLLANARMSRQLRAKTCGLYFFFLCAPLPGQLRVPRLTPEFPGNERAAGKNRRPLAAQVF